MTLPPSDTWLVRGVDAPRYKVGPWCCNPSCSRPADHAHHLWRRSRHGGEFSWMELPDGQVIGNLVALCAYCHGDVTGDIGGHKAAIRVHRIGQDYRFLYCKVIETDAELTFEPVGAIEPQPPALDSPVASPADAGPDVCPSCGQKKPTRRSSSPASTTGERRRRKSWTIKVPDELDEDGAWVLDTLVDDLAPDLGYHPDRDGHYRSARYFVIVPAVVFAQQNRERFLKEVVGR